MSAYVQPPNFESNVGQLVSAADLEVLRHNVALAETYTWRWSEMFADSGGVETGISINHYGGENDDVRLMWNGYLMKKAGMTTLTVKGRTENISTTVLKLYIDGVFKQQWSPGTSSWTRTESLTGYSTDQVVNIQVTASQQGWSASTVVKINDIYGSPLTFADAWPGVPTFGTSFTAADLIQLSNATSWVLNRTALIPRPPLLSERYGLGSCFGPDRRPVYVGTVGRYYTQQQLVFGYQVADNTLPDLHAEVYLNGILAYDSGTLAQGTSNHTVGVSLAGVGASLGDRVEVEIWSNQQDTIPRSQMHFSQWTIWDLTAKPSTYSMYTTPNTGPAGEASVTQVSLTAYLNNLASIVSAAKARIDGQPNFYDVIRAQRRCFTRNANFDELGQKRNPPRFWRTGDALVVNGKNVSLAYGGLTVPTTDRGVAWGDYKWNKSQQIIDNDTLNTQVLFLDTVPGLNRGVAYYLSGEVHWAEESVL